MLIEQGAFAYPQACPKQMHQMRTFREGNLESLCLFKILKRVCLEAITDTLRLLGTVALHVSRKKNRTEYVVNAPTLTKVRHIIHTCTS